MILSLHAVLVNYEDGSRTGLKIPPHEQVLEEGGACYLFLYLAFFCSVKSVLFLIVCLIFQWLYILYFRWFIIPEKKKCCRI